MSEVDQFPTIVRLARAYRRGETTPTEVVTALINDIDARQPTLHAYAYWSRELAMAQAAEAERELASGLDRGPLHGVPIGVKDLCATRDMPTHAGMPLLDPVMPGEDATVVKRLRQAGAIISGKLQMTEGARGEHHPSVLPPVNPWDDDLWAGISSSGPAVATAAGLCHAAIGSDTGGSIRFPASCCGLTGIKPAWGRVSRAGVFPMQESMDHVGPMAHSAEDTALVLAAIAGPDGADPSTILERPPNYPALTAGGLPAYSIGIDEAFVSADVDPEVSAVTLATAQTFVDLGANVAPVSFPQVDALVIECMMGLGAELAVAHAETFPSRAEAYGPELRGALEVAQHISAHDVVLAQRSRRALRRALDRLFDLTPVLLLPTMPIVTPRAADAVEMFRDPEQLGRMMRFTALFNLTGHPTVTVPAGFDRRGAPIGVQLVGRDEADLLRAAHAFQQVTTFHVARPAGRGLEAAVT